MNFKTLGQFASDLMNRARFSNVAGYTFGGKRDLYTALGYQRQLFIEDYRSRYARNAVAARIVEAKPEDTWRGGAELIEDQDPETVTEFEQAFEDLNNRLKIWPHLHRADTLAGLGHYSILLLNAPGALDTPLEHCDAEDLSRLSVFAEDDATIAEFDVDEQSPRFGLPKYYSVRRRQMRSATSINSSSTGKRVHYSRVIHIADGLLDDEVYGTPRLERCWNLIDDLEKVTGGGAEAFWKRADQGLQLDIDPTIDASDEDLTRMQQETDDYIHGLKRVLRTRGVKMNSMGSDVADFSKPVESILAQISTGTGIPQRVLTGSEQGKMAADQDSVKYYRMIEARRADFAGPRVVRPLVDRLIELGVLPMPEVYDVKWSQTRTMDETDKASLAAQWAQLNSQAGETVVTGNEIRQQCLGLGPLAEVIEDSPGSRAHGFESAVPPVALADKKGVAAGKHVLRAADRFRPRAKRIAKTAFRAGREAFDRKDLLRALELRDELGVLTLAGQAITAAEQALREPMQDLLSDVLNASGTATARELKRTLLRAAASAADIKGWKFDVTHPAAKSWVTQHAAETLDDLSATTREGIKDLVEGAFDGDFDVRDLADDIDDLIGDDDRADVIARTETMRASNEGQAQAWSQAVDTGLLTGTEQQEWITTPDDRLCPICAPLDGVKVALSENFAPDLEAPPAHPNCRCTTGLVLSNG